MARYRHRNIMLPSFIWSVMNDQTFECSVAFEDVRVIHDKNEKSYKKPSATITRPLRQRLYGILLHEFENPSVCVKEWCGENSTSYREPVLVKPIAPTGNVSSHTSKYLWGCSAHCITPSPPPPRKDPYWQSTSTLKKLQLSNDCC